MSNITLDPEHISCIGGRTVLTCLGCAGNAPRGAVCKICDGRGFSIFVCAHCNPAAAAASSSTSTTSATATAAIPGSSDLSSSGFLSRSPSTSYLSITSGGINSSPWRRLGNVRDDASSGLPSNTPRNI